MEKGPPMKKGPPTFIVYKSEQQITNNLLYTTVYIDYERKNLI